MLTGADHTKLACATPGMPSSATISTMATNATGRAPGSLLYARPQTRPGSGHMAFVIVRALTAAHLGAFLVSGAAPAGDLSTRSLQTSG
jgi:hypothetical protein